ncbi:MAG: hypothetical protein SFX18_02735 [Pirellulales bacterium]|nr:hypothetical protein [Pirellulales bacterium]
MPQPPPVQFTHTVLQCVEIYVPKKLQHLSDLYRFLENKLSRQNAEEGEAASPETAELDGFSLYEVDGAFRGEHAYQERTLVVRIFFPGHKEDSAEFLQNTIQQLGREIAQTVALQEEELWICHYPQGVTIFRP